MKALLLAIGTAIAAALANIITFMNPDHILLSGKLIEDAGFLLLPLIEDQVKQQLPIHCQNVRIVYLDKNPDNAELAAGLVIKQMFAAPLNTLSY